MISYALKYSKYEVNDKIIMVGYRKHDVIGAIEAKNDSIAVPYGYGDLEELRRAKPKHIVKDINELSEVSI